MKNFKKALLPLGGLLAVILCCYGLYYSENYEEVCYTKIDNNKIEKLSTSDEMKYEYSLSCFKEFGKKKNIKFKTSRELRNDAYLLVELRISGVHSWKEVNFEELPSKVKEKINN